MAPKTLDDLPPETAEKYSDAIAELHAFVEKAMKSGADPFGSEYLEEMGRIEQRLGVSSDCWDYLDLDDLLMSNWN